MFRRQLSSPRRLAAYATLAAGGTGLGYAMPPLDMMQFMTEHPLPHRSSAEATEYHSQLERELMKLPIVRQLESNPDYEMHRAWKAKRNVHDVFTAGRLRLPGGLNVTPVVFVNKRDKTTVSIAHCGRLLTGFPLIVHGGILGTLLDEALGRTAFMSFANSSGVTANLNLSYKAPTLANQFLVVKTQTDNTKEGRKANVSGTIETVQGQTLVKAKGTFVVPRSYSLESMKGL